MIKWFKNLFKDRSVTKAIERIGPLKPYEILVVKGATLDAALSMANELGHAKISDHPVSILAMTDQVDVQTIQMLDESLKQQLREALDA